MDVSYECVYLILFKAPLCAALSLKIIPNNHENRELKSCLWLACFSSLIMLSVVPHRRFLLLVFLKNVTGYSSFLPAVLDKRTSAALNDSEI